MQGTPRSGTRSNQRGGASAMIFGLRPHGMTRGTRGRDGLLALFPSLLSPGESVTAPVRPSRPGVWLDGRDYFS